MKKRDENVDIINLLPKHHPITNAEIVYRIDGEKVAITCTQKGKTGVWKNKVLNPQNQPKQIIVPRFIELNTGFGELIGLYYGDGTKNANCIEFTNFCPELLEVLIRYLSDLSIYYESLEHRIKISSNVKVKYNISELEIIEYWRNRLKIPIQCQIKVNWVNSQCKASNYLRKYGSFVIRYHNSMFALFFNTLVKNIDYFAKSESFRLGFLRGLIAAEGNINIRKNGSLSLLRIAGSRDKRSFISNFINTNFHLKVSDDPNSNQIYIGHRDQFKLIKTLDLYSLHPEKRDQFDRGYQNLLTRLEKLKHKNNALMKNKNAIKLLCILYYRPLYYKEILNSLKITCEWLKMLINGYKSGIYQYKGLQELGVVKKTKNGREFILYITDNGKLFLENNHSKLIGNDMGNYG